MAAGRGRAKKSTRVEDIYQRKSPREHVLLRPDAYVGSTAPVRASVLVATLRGSRARVAPRDVRYTPALLKIIDEIIVNAADNKRRDDDMSLMRVSVDAASGEVSVFNDGRGVPVVVHEDEGAHGAA